MGSKCPDEILHMREVNLNLCILHMFKDTFSFGSAHIIKRKYIKTSNFLKIDTTFIYGKRKAKRCLRVCAKCTDSDSSRACAMSHPDFCTP